MFLFLSQDFIQKAAFTVFVLAITYIISFSLKKSVDVLVSGVNRAFTKEVLLARTRTIRSLVKNSVDVTLFLIAIMIILSRWGVNIIPLLTGAGIAGLALSFGAQTLVKDVISGFFIIVEDQFSVGDKVKIANIEGIVQNVTLRLTILKDKNGHLVYIPNSQIATVVRYDSRPRMAIKRSIN